MSEALGYLVALYEHERWTDTWDGEIHATLADARNSAREARASGWTVQVARLVPVAAGDES